MSGYYKLQISDILFLVNVYIYIEIHILSDITAEKHFKGCLFNKTTIIFF